MYVYTQNTIIKGMYYIYNDVCMNAGTYLTHTWTRIKYY